MELPPLDRVAEFVYEAGHLSRTPRTGYALLRLPEQNVADHSFRVAMIALVLARLTHAADLGRILAMSLIHDLPETRTLDLNGLAKNYVTADRPAVVRDQTAGLPFGDEVESLIEEYEQGTTNEAQLVRDADQLELLLALRERTTAGAKEHCGWIERVMSRLRTAAGRKLAQGLLEVDPDQWWNR